MQILIGLTSRNESRAALDRAVEEAQLRGASLHVVRTMGEGLSENPARARAWADAVEEAKADGERMVADLASRGVTASFRLEPVSSDAAATLLEIAREIDADLLVLGIRRRSPVGKLVLGSVSQDVILGAECPVLAIKAPADGEAG
jgi:nucleotide-binding universal stress UspA family protein